MLHSPTASYPFCEPLSSSTCDCPYQSSINVTTLLATATANAVGGTAAKMSAITLAILLLIMIIIISLLMSLLLIHYYKIKKANNK